MFYISKEQSFACLIGEASFCHNHYLFSNELSGSQAWFWLKDKTCCFSINPFLCVKAALFHIIIVTGLTSAAVLSCFTSYMCFF